jgi:hypothetical protein
MSYFGLMALFPALLLMFAIGNKVAAGSQLLTHAVDVLSRLRQVPARHDRSFFRSRRRCDHYVHRARVLGRLLGFCRHRARSESHLGHRSENFSCMVAR